MLNSDDLWSVERKNTRLTKKRLLPAAPDQEGPGLCLGEVGQRPSPHGQASPRLDPPRPLV